jgi:flagellar L-ring protein precursor FlgH
MVKKIQIKVIIFILGFILYSAAVFSDTLWGKKSSPYSANQASKIGDVVTIIIEESSHSSLSADTNGKKTSEVDSDIVAAWRRVAALVEGSGEQRTIGSGKVSGGNKFTGSGQTARSSAVRAVISVVIVGVKPNGNLEIRGSHKVKINEELEEINIAGEIRSSDITADNTVLSSQIAGAQISIEGSGPVGNQQSPGILTRFLNWLF